MLKALKNRGRVLLAGAGFFYDLKRYWSHAGWKARLEDHDERNYYMVKVYHALEKSMSFSERRPGGGWDNALRLIDALEQLPSDEKYGFHDRMALQVLERFIEIENVNNPERCNDLFHRVERIKNKHTEVADGLTEKPGAIFFTNKRLDGARLNDPEGFFLTRNSLREFSADSISEDVLGRAVKLAMGSPSVCNRQAWHVYHLTGSKAQTALAHQNGNRGFGHNVKQVLIVASDLKAFCSPNERYQHWIDGGMFSMSLVWALHSLGLASCCLNWSQSGRVDMRLRKLLPIKEEHTIIMMIAVGYPRENNAACSSLRRPVEEIYTLLDDDNEKNDLKFSRGAR